MGQRQDIIHADIENRNEALHLLLSRTLRNPVVQDTIMWCEILLAGWDYQKFLGSC